MHDQLIERRLRETLRAEADSVAFTISAAELDRRAILRGRSVGNRRRLTLLLAAVVGIALLGIGSLVAGLVDRQSPIVVAPTDPPSERPAPTASETLPSLDELIAAGDPATAVVAQSHGPADGPAPQAPLDPRPAQAGLGNLEADAAYEITVACLSSNALVLDLRVPFSRGPESGPTIACDGAVHSVPAEYSQVREVSLRTWTAASWRVVVRRVEGAATPPMIPPPPLQFEGFEELVRLEAQDVEADGQPPDASGLLLRELDAVPDRESYSFALWCAGGPSIRYIHGGEIDGAFMVATATQVPCDAKVHEGWLAIPQEFGGRVFVSAQAGTRFSILVASSPPPVALAHSEPGWQLSASAGPHYAYETRIHNFTLPGVDGGGPVNVVLACVGPEAAIEVTVDFGVPIGARRDSFTAACSGEGATVGQTFDAEGSYVDISFSSPSRTWTALSILVPDPLP